MSRRVKAAENNGKTRSPARRIAAERTLVSTMSAAYTQPISGLSPVPQSAASYANGHKRYFFEKFGISERLLERCLGEALAAGGDYADLYFESVTATSLGVDEQIVKSASQGTSAGCGIRVLSGERTGYPS